MIHGAKSFLSREAASECRAKAKLSMNPGPWLLIAENCDALTKAREEARALVRGVESHSLNQQV